jgi:hypothetical protein
MMATAPAEKRLQEGSVNIRFETSVVERSSFDFALATPNNNRKEKQASHVVKVLPNFICRR